MDFNLLTEMIKHNSWLDVPGCVISREGHQVDTSTNVWHLPYANAKSMSLNFKKIINVGIRWATKRYIQDRLEFTSTHAAYSSFQDAWREIIRYESDFYVNEYSDNDDLKQKLIKIFELALAEARKNHRLWSMYRPVQWYVWCAENYPEIGFVQPMH